MLSSTYILQIGKLALPILETYESSLESRHTRSQTHIHAHVRLHARSCSHTLRNYTISPPSGAQRHTLMFFFFFFFFKSPLDSWRSF
uniref:Uncharacterized protein n=1 Tax=Anguilla anguilla TaxID=7936 RepID=A0A0E9UR97_ANGAN